MISINTIGLQAWTLIVNLKDTPKGLKIDVEQVGAEMMTGAALLPCSGPRRGWVGRRGGANRLT